MSEKRLAAYTNESFVEADGTYYVALVEEGSPGYWKSTYTGDLDYVKAVADSINESKGYTPEDVTKIVASSMFAGPVPKDELAPEART